MHTLAFWRDAGERALRTGAQVLIGLLGVDLVNITAVPWSAYLGTSATAAVISVLMSLAASGKADTLGPASLASAPYPVYKTNDHEA